MRRVRVSVLLAMSALALLATLPAAAQAGADIFAVGGGHIVNNKFGTFDLSAHTGPNGDFGHVATRVPTVVEDIYVDVDCVSVYGALNVVGAAWVAGTVKRVSPNNALGVEVGDRQTFYVHDGGKPSSVPVDSFLFFATSVVDCRLLPRVVVLPPDVSEGNVNIKLG